MMTTKITLNHLPRNVERTELNVSVASTMVFQLDVQVE